MLFLSSTALVLIGAIAVFATPTESSRDVTQSISTNLSCTSDQTPCLFGCCPYAGGVCCADGYECCQHGQTCIPIFGICLEIVGSKKKNPVLVSSKAIAVSIALPCPNFTTTCGPDRCCLYPDAVCCSDGEHCCPHGYRCDVPNLKCVKSSDNTNSTVDLNATPDMKSLEPVKTVKKDPYKSCPGGARQCPSYMSCCLNDEGSWGCCPNPSSPVYIKGTENCCTSLFGYICCTGPIGMCTFLGCFL